MPNDKVRELAERIADIRMGQLTTDYVECVERIIREALRPLLGAASATCTILLPTAEQENPLDMTALEQKAVERLRDELAGWKGD